MLVIIKVKNTVPQTYVMENLNGGEEVVETFYEKELQKANQAEFKIESVIKKYDNSFRLTGQTSYFPQPYSQSKKINQS